ncbi:MAG: LamG-like jellyroll fold domain-containing protein [Woeseiaceae bacterium]|nr:LamG-like jellyroll fold domain-containing protein [Woeseiaceae bacterium]
MHALLTRPGKKSFRILWLSNAATLCALTVNAQELLVHLPLDGTVQNAGSGGAAEVVGAGPATVQGHIGSAMKFDGHSVIAVPVDLSPEQYPRVTITAWVRADETAPDTDHSIVSSGRQGTTPALRLSKRRYGVKASMRGARSALLASSYSPTEEWVFVAGTIDVPAQTLHVMQNDSTYDRDGVRTKSLYPASKHVNPDDPDADPKAWVFIGARTFDPALAPAVGIAVDDVRVYGSALTTAQLADVRDAVGAQSVASAGVELPGQPGGEFTPPDNQSPTADILRERDGGVTDIDQIEAREEMGSGRDASVSDQPTLTDDTGDRHQLPDQEEIQVQAEQVAGEAAIEGAEQRAAEREEQARQQAEQQALAEAERRAAQEEEAANEDGDPDRPMVWRFSETETHLTEVSGRTGDIVRPDDSFNKFSRDQYAEFYGGAGMLSILVGASNNVPCEIDLLVGYDGNVLVEDTGISECANRLGYDGILVQIPGAMTALQVCTNPRNGRVKGLQIRGHALESDGTFGAYAQATESLPNCAEWSTLVVCNSQHAATGFVAHFDDRRGNSSSNALVGLQLICRKIVKGGP